MSDEKKLLEAVLQASGKIAQNEKDERDKPEEKKEDDNKEYKPIPLSPIRPKSED